MLAETAARLRGIVATENILVVTATRLRKGVERALPALPRTSILCEPVGRNTAPCVAWAAMEIRRRDPDGVMIVLPADHVVRPLDVFRATVLDAMQLADRSASLVTFGIKPTAPETGYGYIRAGRRVARARRAYAVDAFHEKPSAARARRFVRDGRFFWNSGMFAWRADVILEEIAEHASLVAAGIEKLRRAHQRARLSQALVDRVYPGLPSISIDHAVMEKSRRVLMVAAPFAWSDIGSWDAVAALWPRDRARNSSRDPLVAVAAKNNVVATGGKPVALIGVDDLAIIDSGDAILVCRRERAQDVRAVVAALEGAGLGSLV
jgi:mannose-1-phosphate guanylyltransferase